MKLTIEFNGNQQKFSLQQDLSVDIETDAEALGYAAMVCFKSAEVLADYARKANPKYQPRINVGIAYADNEQKKENNPIWPFQKMITEDEK